MKCVPTFRTLSLKRIKAELFPFSRVVLRQKEYQQLNFPLTLLVYHIKISILIKKQNVMAYRASIKDSIQLKSAFKHIISNSLLIVEAKPVKSRITENLTTFQKKPIRKLFDVNQQSVKISFSYD